MTKIDKRTVLTLLSALCLSALVLVKADIIQNESVTLKRSLPPGVSLEVVRNALWSYFSQSKDFNANVSYVTTWNVSPTRGRTKPATVREKVTGPTTEWTYNEYIVKLIEYSSLFNLYNLLGRIQSGGLKLELRAVCEAEARDIANIAAPISSGNYVYLVAEDNSDLYTLTLEELAPWWVPVIIKHQKKDGSEQARMVAWSVSHIRIYLSSYALPRKVRIIDEEGKVDLEVVRVRVEKK